MVYKTKILHYSNVQYRLFTRFYGYYKATPTRLSFVCVHHSTISQFDPCDSHVTNLPCVCMGGCMCMCVYVQQNYECFHAVSCDSHVTSPNSILLSRSGMDGIDCRHEIGVAPCSTPSLPLLQ